jgi:signal transduction histidine kinase
VGIAGALVFNSPFLLQSSSLLPLPTKSGDIWQQWVSALGLLLGAVFCFSRMRRVRRERPNESKHKTVVRNAQRWVPFCIGLAFLMMSVATGVKGSTVWTSSTGHVPYWTNSFELVRYPCFLVAILCLPSRPLSSSARLRLVLDGVLVITALITFSWYFLLGPLLLFHSYTTLVDKLVGAAFPFGDLMLCSCLLQLVTTSHTQMLQPTRWLLLFGLASLIVAGSINAYQIVHTTRPLEIWIVAFESLGYLLIVVAVQAIYLTTSRRESSSETSSRRFSRPEVVADPSIWQVLLPSLFVPAVGGLVFFVWQRGTQGLLAEGVYLGSILISVLLLSRQALFIQETYVYNKKLYSMQLELHDKNSRLEEQAKELKDAYEQQRQINDLKDQLLLNVNHELRTPLTELNGYLELLQACYDQIDAETQRQFIERALHGGGELLRLVNTVLDALQSADAQVLLHTEELSINEMVQRAVEVFGPRIWQDYQLQITVPEHLMVKADRQYVHQVLCNLLSNACKYSPSQTVVEIGASESIIAEQDKESIKEVSIWVKDTGPGIAANDIPLLFEKFVRLKRDRASTIRGTGLGLYICKQLISTMGGRIWVESAGIPGQGSRFCFTLPCP